jgi:C-terminal processing protease CtpA/Prc
MNRTDMIFDLSSIWATVKEVFPYFDRLQMDWDAQYRTYLEIILQVSDEGEFHRLLTEFMECLNDGHTKYFPPAAYRKAKPFVRPDAPSFTIDAGVLTIKLNEFMKNHAPYVKELLATTPNISLVRLDIRNNIGGNTYHAAKVAELFISGTFQSCQKWTQVCNAVGIAGASQLVSYSEEEIQKCIRDGMFTEDAISDAKSVMNRTKYETYTSSHGVENQRAIYDGPLQILISRNTMSAAEDFTAMFKGNKRATLIGEPTYGSTGTPCMIPLRCGGRAQVVSVGYRLADGTEFIGKGIMPDIEKDATSL